MYEVCLFFKKYLVLGLCDPIDPFVTIVLRVCLMASHKWWYFTQVHIIPRSISLSLSLKIFWKNQEYDSFGLSQTPLSLVNVGSNSTLYLSSKHSMEIKDQNHYCWKRWFPDLPTLGRNYRLGLSVQNAGISRYFRHHVGITDMASLEEFFWRAV